FSDDREGQEKANRLMNWLDVTGANIPAAAYDTGQAAARGDIPSLAITGAALLAPALGRKLKANQLEDFLSDSSGMFMGPKAAKADLTALSHAQYLKESGATRDEIFNKTGWFQQKDGKWRFEIPSNEAEYLPSHRSV